MRHSCRDCAISELGQHFGQRRPARAGPGWRGGRWCLGPLQDARRGEAQRDGVRGHEGGQPAIADLRLPRAAVSGVRHRTVWQPQILCQRWHIALGSDRLDARGEDGIVRLGAAAFNSVSDYVSL